MSHVSVKEVLLLINQQNLEYQKMEAKQSYHTAKFLEVPHQNYLMESIKLPGAKVSKQVSFGASSQYSQNQEQPSFTNGLGGSVEELYAQSRIPVPSLMSFHSQPSITPTNTVYQENLFRSYPEHSTYGSKNMQNLNPQALIHRLDTGQEESAVLSKQKSYSNIYRVNVDSQHASTQLKSEGCLCFKW